MSIERHQHKISFVSLNASNDYYRASKDPYCKYIMHMSLFINNHTFVFIHNFLTLTYWGQVTHVCVGKLTIICSDNGLLSGRRQAGILLIEPLGTIFSEILIGIQIFSLNKMRLKMSSAKWRPFLSRPLCVKAITSWDIVLCCLITLKFVGHLDTYSAIAR